MIDFAMPYSASWRVFRVDERTWADGERVYGMTEASVCREADGSLIESGSFTVDMPVGEEFQEGYYRIAMTAHQNGVSERVDVTTLRCMSTSGRIGRGRNLQSIKGTSVLYPASTESVALGGYAPAGINGAEHAAGMLASCLKAPVRRVGSFTLDTPIVWQQSWKVLDCVWAELDAGNFTIMIDGRGEVVVGPKPTDPALVIDGHMAYMVGTEVSGGIDWSGVHNRYYAIEGTSVAVAVNDDPNSPTSTVSRGYNSDVVDRSPKRVNGETLDAYAERKLRTDSIVTVPRTYVREWYREVLPNMVIKGSIPAMGLDGLMRVKSQRLTLKNGISVEERAEMEVSSWQ